MSLARDRLATPPRTTPACGAAARQPRTSPRHAVVLAVLLVLFAARLIDTARRKSFTFDEPNYVGTGLYLWKTGDYQWFTVLGGQTPLTFHLAALPLVFVDLPERPTPDLGFRLLGGAPATIAQVRFLSRLPFVALACWGAWLVFAWARAVAGPTAGVVAVFCYTFCTTVLANASLAHSDITVTVLFVQTLFCLWRWWNRPTLGRLALTGLSLGLALIAKQSALLLCAAIGLLLAAAIVTGRPATGPGSWALPAGLGRRVAWGARVLAILGVLVTAVVWCGYGGSFATAPAPLEPDLGWPAPAFVRAFLFDYKANAGGRAVYLHGQFADHGWWYFFPLAFAVKTPVGLLVLLALAIAAPRARPAEAAAAGHGVPIGPFLGVPILVYALVACFVLRVPLGIRYVLPILPLVWLFVAVRLVADGGSVRRGIAVAAGLWIAIASLTVHPHYLAYFNEAVGGPRNGPRWLIESNLDWGQDLGTLAAWLRSRGNPPVHLAYFGRERPASYGLDVVGVPGCTPVPGLVAVSVDVLMGLYGPSTASPPARRDCYAWLRDRTPIAAPGWSILVYDVPPS